jgi:DNA-binding transcriptional LysR family regulator
VEEELDILLLHRVGKRVLLTEAGQIVQHYAEQVLGLAHDTQRALRELQSLQRGTLRLVASSKHPRHLPPAAVRAFLEVLHEQAPRGKARET